MNYLGKTFKIGGFSFSHKILFSCLLELPGNRILKCMQRSPICLCLEYTVTQYSGESKLGMIYLMYIYIFVDSI